MRDLLLYDFVLLHIYRRSAQQDIIQEWCGLQLQGMDSAVRIATRAFHSAFASVNPWDNASVARKYQSGHVRSLYWIPCIREPLSVHHAEQSKQPRQPKRLKKQRQPRQPRRLKKQRPQKSPLALFKGKPALPAYI